MISFWFSVSLGWRRAGGTPPFKKLRWYFGALAGLLDRHWIEEGHHASQLDADFFDLLLLFFLAGGFKPFAAGLVFLDPLLREGAVLDFAQQLPHGLAGLLGHDTRSGSVVAIFAVSLTE